MPSSVTLETSTPKDKSSLVFISSNGEEGSTIFDPSERLLQDVGFKQRIFPFLWLGGRFLIVFSHDNISLYSRRSMGSILVFPYKYRFSAPATFCKNEAGTH